MIEQMVDHNLPLFQKQCQPKIHQRCQLQSLFALGLQLLRLERNRLDLPKCHLCIFEATAGHSKGRRTGQWT